MKERNRETGCDVKNNKKKKERKTTAILAISKLPDKYSIQYSDTKNKIQTLRFTYLHKWACLKKFYW